MGKETWCPLEDLKKERLWYSVVVRDRQGKVLSRERRKSKSFLKQWNVEVYTLMAATSYDFTDTDGNPRPAHRDIVDFSMNAAAGVTDYGIRVGTGNLPVDISDFQLGIPIVEGAGPGQMEHLVCTVATSVVADPSCYFVVSRSIVNNSPDVITVREAVIYMRMVEYYACAVRDVLTTPPTVPIGGTITIDWTIQVTV